MKYLKSEVNVKFYDIVKMEVGVFCEYLVSQSYEKKRERGGRVRDVGTK